MKISQIGVIAVMLVVIAVALAGCTGSSPAAPATSGGASSGGAQSGGAQTTAGSAAASGSVSGSDLFDGFDYDWVEYKIASGTGDQQMTIYMKWAKNGKCSMRFEGAGAAQMQGMPTEMDCSTSGSGQAQNNPNEIPSDIGLVKVGTETVTVPAGTFVADKYTLTSEGVTGTYWFVVGKPLIKFEGGSSEGGNAVMELNGWG